MRNRIALGRMSVCLRWSSMGLLLGLAVPIVAAAQTGPAETRVPDRAFFVGAGVSYDWVNFSRQDIFGIGTSNVFRDGTLTTTGEAAGPGTVDLDSSSNPAPSIQVGYFQRFGDSDWLWGAKLAYSYVGTSSTAHGILLPQVGVFTITATGERVPFVGSAVARSYETSVEHQIALAPIVGWSFLERSFVYVGGGPTLSRTQTRIKSLVGFADIRGTPTDVSGAPVDFSSASWVWGGIATIGVTWFLTPSWFIDANYAYSRTSDYTSHYSKPFVNPNGSMGLTTGTLVGTSSGNVAIHGITLTINWAF
jgi:opacity protein-like surface antigen